MYACDFETRNEIPASVWHWGYAEIGNIDNWNWGTTLDSFMLWCSGINDTIYFHNLRHDGNFIIHWLLSNGFTHNTERKHYKNTFKTLISKENVWYSIEICWEDKQSRRVITKIYDSFKKLPFKLSSIAIDLKLPLLKGEIDYNKHRPIGYEPTQNEIDYLENDCKILALAMEIQFEEQLTKMTIGSDSLNTYKLLMGNEDKKKGEKKYRKLFPILDTYIDKIVRKSYRGGWTYLNPVYANLTIGEGIVLDVVSEYPWAMRNNLMPYGTPMFFKGKYKENSTYPLYVQELECSFELKDKHLPMIQIKDMPLYFKKNTYLTSSEGLRVRLSLTNIDLQLFLDHYHVIDPDYIHGFMFKGANGLFDDYIDKFMEEKIKYDDIPSKRLKAKLLLNNLYGKFGSSIDVTGRVPVLKDNVVKYVIGDEEKGDPQYVAVASFTTAYARNLIIRRAQKNYDRFIYCDTDSLHLTGTTIPQNMIDDDVIHKTELGKFSVDDVFIKGKYLFQKTYMYQKPVCNLYNKQGERLYHDTSLKIAGAGMTDDVKKNFNFDNFEAGATVAGSKKGRVVEGGVIIEDKLFTLRERGRI